MLSILKKLSRDQILIVSLFLFFALLPLTLKINFWQNDDWNRITTTKQFIQGNFTLRQETANTFYLQGFLGMIFFFLTRSTHFSLLTLIFSVANFYLFSKIIYDFFIHKYSDSLLLGFLFFLNPFHIYSLWGFMAENFYIFFLLLSVYFFLLSRKNSKSKFLIASNIFNLLGFFIKQVSMVTMAAYLVFFAFSRKKREFLIQISFFFFTVGFYYFLFPRTSEMETKDLSFLHFSNYKYLLSITWANLVYLAAFILPLVFILFTRNLKLLKLLLMALAGIPVYVLVNKFFNANLIGPGEFPYIQNTFTRFGFYSLNLRGTPYSIMGKFDLFNSWQLLAVISALLLLGLLFLYFKKLNNPFFYFLGGYLFLMLLITEMFDRYLLPIFPIAILLFVSLVKEIKLWEKAIITLFVLFLFILNYQFSMNFVLTNNYLYGKAESLMKQNEIYEENISVNRAWKKIYNNPDKEDLSKPKYIFSYDSQNVNKYYSDYFDLVEMKKIDYPLNIHVNPYIYLYKSKTLEYREAQ